jgi:hypothetical protein
MRLASCRSPVWFLHGRQTVHLLRTRACLNAGTHKKYERRTFIDRCANDLFRFGCFDMGKFTDSSVSSVQCSSQLQSLACWPVTAASFVEKMSGEQNSCVTNKESVSIDNLSWNKHTAIFANARPTGLHSSWPNVHTTYFSPETQLFITTLYHEFVHNTLQLCSFVLLLHRQYTFLAMPFSVATPTASSASHCTQNSRSLLLLFLLSVTLVLTAEI